MICIDYGAYRWYKINIGVTNSPILKSYIAQGLREKCISYTEYATNVQVRSVKYVRREI